MNRPSRPACRSPSELRRQDDVDREVRDDRHDDSSEITHWGVSGPVCAVVALAIYTSYGFVTLPLPYRASSFSFAS